MDVVIAGTVSDNDRRLAMQRYILTASPATPDRGIGPFAARCLQGIRAWTHPERGHVVEARAEMASRRLGGQAQPAPIALRAKRRLLRTPAEFRRGISGCSWLGRDNWRKDKQTGAGTWPAASGACAPQYRRGGWTEIYPPSDDPPEPYVVTCSEQGMPPATCIPPP